MLFNEFSTVLGAALLVAEHLSLICSGYRRSGSLPATIAAAAVSRRLWLDALSLCAALGAYVLFRVINPSGYNGNSLDGLQRLQETWITVYRHVVSGTVFPRLGCSAPAAAGRAEVCVLHDVPHRGAIPIWLREFWRPESLE